MIPSRSLLALALGVAPVLAAEPAPAPAETPTAPAAAAPAAAGPTLGEKTRQVLDTMEFHGFMSQGYMVTKNNNYLAGETNDGGSWDMREVGVNASVQVTDKLRVGAQIFGRKLADLESVDVDWAYVDYRASDAIGFRAGLVKVPRGLYNELQDLDLATSTVILPQAMYDLRLRDFQVAAQGVQVYGNLRAGGAGNFDYSGYFGDRHMETDGSIAKYFREGLASFGEYEIDQVDLDWTAGGQVMWNTPLDGLKVGVSYVHYGELSTDGTIPAPGFLPLPPGTTLATTGSLKDLFSWVYSAEYLAGDWRFAAEYTRWSSDGEVDIQLLGQTPVNYQPEGMYGQIAWQATDWMELAGTASLWYGNQDNHAKSNPSSYQHDYYLSAKFNITDNWIFKMEGHYIEGTALSFASDNPDGVKDQDVAFLAKTTISF
ncbi:MAG: hypothetical protein RLZZ127_1777 [Planctomycetota bacterium]|jgi:hypothetical protein